MNKPGKVFPVIGCCGIDCGLCPRYYTAGASQCPGCGAPGFRDKHPACGALSCCVGSRGCEVCADCGDYPCKRFEAEKAGQDSFVTHRRISDNLSEIRRGGIDAFIAQQRRRITALECLLEKADDGRSKSFYCLACALLPTADIEAAAAMTAGQCAGLPKPELARAIKQNLEAAAERCGEELRLRKDNR
jgi:hypothetical protein